MASNAEENSKYSKDGNKYVCKWASQPYQEGHAF